MGDKIDRLKEEVSKCCACGLRAQAKQVVLADGNEEARILFVGEGPGAEEDKSGTPFVGRSGDLLRGNIKACYFPPKYTYIDNTVRCRPPGNRDPLPEEMDACWKWTAATLKALRHLKIIVPLGKPALHTLAYRLGFYDKIGQLPITKLAGKPIWLDDRRLYVFLKR